MPTRRRFFTLTGAALLTGCATGRDGANLAPGTTLIVIRHTERDGELLTKAGQARARALVGALGDMPLDAIYSPGIRRNLDTAAPLADARGLNVQRRPAENPGPRLARDSAGRSVLWVGNKDNIRAIWTAFALPDPAPLDYGDLYVVHADAQGHITLQRNRFGD